MILLKPSTCCTLPITLTWKTTQSNYLRVFSGFHRTQTVLQWTTQLVRGPESLHTDVDPSTHEWNYEKNHEESKSEKGILAGRHVMLKMQYCLPVP